MTKRTIIIGGYDTAANGWTLTGLSLSAPEQKTHYFEKSAGDGSWDLSTALTDGIPRYRDRSLAITLECSEGNRAERSAKISDMVNRLDGLEWQIVHPDHPQHYLTGRVHVAEDFNTPAHAGVTLSAICAPWLFKAQETAFSLTATDDEKTVVLPNNGRRVVVPLLTVTGSVLLEYGTSSISLTDVVGYEWPTLLLTPGDHSVVYSGEGTMVIKYREAVLR